MCVARLACGMGSWADRAGLLKQNAGENCKRKGNAGSMRILCGVAAGDWPDFTREETAKQKETRIQKW